MTNLTLIAFWILCTLISGSWSQDDGPDISSSCANAVLAMSDAKNFFAVNKLEMQWESLMNDRRSGADAIMRELKSACAALTGSGFHQPTTCTLDGSGTIGVYSGSDHEASCIPGSPDCDESDLKAIFHFSLKPYQDATHLCADMSCDNGWTASVGGCSSSSGGDGSNGGSGLSGGAIAGIVLGALAAVALVLVGVWYYLKRKKDTKHEEGYVQPPALPPPPPGPSGLGPPPPPPGTSGWDNTQDKAPPAPLLTNQ